MPPLLHVRSALRAALILAAAVALSLYAHADDGRDALFRLERVIVAEHGGTVGWDAVRSVRLEGTLEQGGRTFTFVLVRKRPNLLRVAFREEGSDVEVTYGYNGRNAWRALKQGGQTEAQRLTQTDALKLKHEAVFEHPLINFDRKAAKITHLGAFESADGDISERVEVAHPDGVVEILYMRPDNGLIQRKDTRFPNVAEGSPPLVTIYREYNTLIGFPLPIVIENVHEGTTLSTVTVDKWRAAFGVFNSYFAMPATE